LHTRARKPNTYAMNVKTHSRKKIEPTKEMIEQLLDLASIGTGRVEIAKEMGVSRMTIARWVVGKEYPEIKEAYLDAKRAYAEDLAERLVQEASQPLHEDPKLANAAVARSRLIVETSKWIAARLLPKVYGDNLHIQHAHSGEIKISPLAQLRQLESKGPIVDISKQPKVIEAETVNEDKGE